MSETQVTNEEYINESEMDGEESVECPYKEGEELIFVRVRFHGNAKSFPFLIGKRKFNYGQKVVAMSDRGMAVGYINSFPYKVQFDKSMMPVRHISKVATEEDLQKDKEQLKKEKEAENLCLKYIEKYKLDMNLTHVQIIQYGKKAVFYFNAPQRVDFRDLVKSLVTDLKMRIELRQISVRDRTAALGGIGVCGLQTCCSSFLKNYGNINIKMAKNQNLAMVQSKLNGICGQVKCCLKYEDDVYTDKRALLPLEESIIKVKNGDIGKVIKLHIIAEQFEMITENGKIRRYSRNQLDDRLELPRDYRFPDRFEHVVNETKDVIGLIEEQRLKQEQFLREIEKERIEMDRLLEGVERSEENLGDSGIDEIEEEFEHLEEELDEIDEELEVIEEDLKHDKHKLNLNNKNDTSSEYSGKAKNPNQQARPNQNRNNNRNQPQKNEGRNKYDRPERNNNNRPQNNNNRPSNQTTSGQPNRYSGQQNASQPNRYSGQQNKNQPSPNRYSQGNNKPQTNQNNPNKENEITKKD